MFRILVQRLLYSEGTMLIGVTDPLPDGMCISLWAGQWPKHSYRTEGLGHDSAEVCDKYVEWYCSQVPGGVMLDDSIVLHRDREEVLDVLPYANIFQTWCAAVLDEAAIAIGGAEGNHSNIAGRATL